MMKFEGAVVLSAAMTWTKILNAEVRWELR
jgi:hypothetical protein